MRPCPAVKFVTRPPARAKPSAAEAEECSDSGSMNFRCRSPDVRGAVGDGDLVDRRHGRRGRDRVGAGAVADPRLDVGDGLRAVDDGRNAWKLGGRRIRHDGRFTQCAQLAGQCASVQMLEQGAANPAGDRLALLVRMPVGSQHGDPSPRGSVAQCRNHRPPSARNVGIEQHHVRTSAAHSRAADSHGSPGRRSETMTGEVIAERLGCGAVLTDDEQSAQRVSGNRRACRIACALGPLHP